jgi:hypothetical protein
VVWIALLLLAFPIYYSVMNSVPQLAFLLDLHRAMYWARHLDSEFDPKDHERTLSMHQTLLGDISSTVKTVFPVLPKKQMNSLVLYVKDLICKNIWELSNYQKGKSLDWQERLRAVYSIIQNKEIPVISNDKGISVTSKKIALKIIINSLCAVLLIFMFFVWVHICKNAGWPVDLVTRIVMSLFVFSVLSSYILSCFQNTYLHEMISKQDIFMKLVSMFKGKKE